MIIAKILFVEWGSEGRNSEDRKFSFSEDRNGPRPPWGLGYVKLARKHHEIMTPLCHFPFPQHKQYFFANFCKILPRLDLRYELHLFYCFFEAALVCWILAPWSFLPVWTSCRNFCEVREADVCDWTFDPEKILSLSFNIFLSSLAKKRNKRERKLFRKAGYAFNLIDSAVQKNTGCD